MAIIDGNNFPNFLLGTPDDDTITGFAARDFLFGKEGNDELYGDYAENDLSGNPIAITITTDDTTVVRKAFYSDKLFGGEGIDKLVGDLETSVNTFASGVENSEAILSFKKGDDVLFDKLDSTPGPMNISVGDTVTAVFSMDSGMNNQATLMGGDNKIYLSGDGGLASALVVGNVAHLEYSSTDTGSSMTTKLDDNKIYIHADLTNSVVAGNMATHTETFSGVDNHSFTEFGDDRVFVKSVTDSHVVGDVDEETILPSSSTETSVVKKYGNDSVAVHNATNSTVSGDSGNLDFNGAVVSQMNGMNMKLDYGNDWMGVEQFTNGVLVGDQDHLRLLQMTDSSDNTFEIQTGRDSIEVDELSLTLFSGDLNEFRSQWFEDSTHNTTTLHTKGDDIAIDYAVSTSIAGDMTSLVLDGAPVAVTGSDNNTYHVQTGNDDIQVDTVISSAVVGDVGGGVRYSSPGPGFPVPTNIVLNYGEHNTYEYHTGRDTIEINTLTSTLVSGDLTELLFASEFEVSGNTGHIHTNHDWINIEEITGGGRVTGDIDNQAIGTRMYESNGANNFQLITGNDDISVHKMDAVNFFGDINIGDFILFNEVADGASVEDTKNDVSLKTGHDWINLGENTGPVWVVGDYSNMRTFMEGENNHLKANYGNDDISLNYHSTGSSLIMGDTSNLLIDVTVTAPDDIANSVKQFMGNDSIKGGGGDDLIFGDSDVININLLTPDNMPVTENNDVILIKHGNDVIDGSKGNDEIHGDTTQLSVNGDPTVMSTNSEAGYDIVYGDDVMSGGKGEDNFVFRVELNPDMEMNLESKGQGKDKILDFNKMDDTLTLLTTQDVGGTPAGLDPFVNVMTQGSAVTIKFDDHSQIKLLGIAGGQNFDSLDDLSQAGFDIHVETIV